MKQGLVIFALLCLPLVVCAQERYYDDAKTFQGEGYEYQCDVLKGGGEGIVSLYNKACRFIHKDQINRRTRQPFGFDPSKQLQFLLSFCQGFGKCIP